MAFARGDRKKARKEGSKKGRNERRKEGWKEVVRRLVELARHWELQAGDYNDLKSRYLER